MVTRGNSTVLMQNFRINIKSGLFQFHENYRPYHLKNEKKAMSKTR